MIVKNRKQAHKRYETINYHEVWVVFPFNIVLLIPSQTWSIFFVDFARLPLNIKPHYRTLSSDRKMVYISRRSMMLSHVMGTSTLNINHQTHEEK